MKTAVLNVLGMPSVKELSIEGWVFNLPLHAYVSYFLSSPHLRRVRLINAFSGLHSAERMPSEFRPVTLPLEQLMIQVDDGLDVRSALAAGDFHQLLQHERSEIKSMELVVSPSLASFGNLEEFFSGKLATSIQMLTVTFSACSLIPYTCPF